MTTAFVVILTAWLEFWTLPALCRIMLRAGRWSGEHCEKNSVVAQDSWIDNGPSRLRNLSVGRIQVFQGKILN